MSGSVGLSVLSPSDAQVRVKNAQGHSGKSERIGYSKGVRYLITTLLVIGILTWIAVFAASLGCLIAFPTMAYKYLLLCVTGLTLSVLPLMVAFQ